MAIDGEWRAGMIDDAGVHFDYGVAPFPVPDDQADTVRQGLPLRHDHRGRQHQQEAERRLGVRQVPHHRHQGGGELRQRDPQHPVDERGPGVARPRQSPAVKAFIEIAQNPNSNTTPASPNGGAYQQTLQDVGYAYESGKETDLQGGLDGAAKQIDTDIDQAQ